MKYLSIAVVGFIVTLLGGECLWAGITSDMLATEIVCRKKCKKECKNNKTFCQVTCASIKHPNGCR